MLHIEADFLRRRPVAQLQRSYARLKGWMPSPSYSVDRTRDFQGRDCNQKSNNMNVQVYKRMNRTISAYLVNPTVFRAVKEFRRLSNRWGEQPIYLQLLAPDPGLPSAAFVVQPSQALAVKAVVHFHCQILCRTEILGNGPT